MAGLGIAQISKFSIPNESTGEAGGGAGLVVVGGEKRMVEVEFEKSAQGRPKTTPKKGKETSRTLAFVR